ncbi:hypothetical protein AB0O68_27485 [Streptomyces sp. NPDC087512]|uniref:hypothetical protein n=1 Tax=Streptomyces sp. NPDC087512 TaxID=3155059 RepID=UPI0034494726
MSWTRGAAAALAVCVLLPTGSAGRGSRGDEEPVTGTAPTSAGRLLDRTDEDGRRHREAHAGRPPEVGVEVEPAAGEGWDVRPTVRGFRFWPRGTPARAVPGRGAAHLFVDGDLVTRLRVPRHRLAAGIVPRGTHQVTARLYADDGTVRAVDGEPGGARRTSPPRTRGPPAPPSPHPAARRRRRGRRRRWGRRGRRGT